MTTDRQTWIYRGFTVAGIALLAAIYFVPIWWVSLTAPNYPPEAFPDGVRIHFHANGVFNGCEKVAKTEITETEALDCVHEMDTINHYVGMYPIAAGGVLEKAFSPFLFTLLACAFECLFDPFHIPISRYPPGQSKASLKGSASDTFGQSSFFQAPANRRSDSVHAIVPAHGRNRRIGSLRLATIPQS